MSRTVVDLGRKKECQAGTCRAEPIPGPHSRFCEQCGPKFENQRPRRAAAAELEHAAWSKPGPGEEPNEHVTVSVEFGRSVKAAYDRLVRPEDRRVFDPFLGMPKPRGKK